MAEKKGFDLASVLGDVSKLNTEAEQIVLIPADRIDPDPANFYSLEGLEDLAANIELIGLQQPLRVRPAGDRYIIVSGHRRRAAILLIRDGGSEQFSAGVPCIVEYGEASPAMRELRLIYANASSRQMNAADLSKQAERVTELLYQLKEQGVEFPGRMREHVAQACKVSTSKLARLHAIRTNLHPALLKFFDGGSMTEDAAYQLSRLPESVQYGALAKIENDKKFRMPTGAVVQKINKQIENYDKPRPCPAHAGGPQCHHLHELRVRDLFQRYEWDVCSTSFCCMECISRYRCSKACKEAKDKAKLEKAVQEEKDRARLKHLEDERNALQRKMCRRAEALLPLIEAAHLKDDQRLFDRYDAASVADVKAWANGETDGKIFTSEDSLVPYFTRDVLKMARLLKVSPGPVLDPFHAAEASKAPAAPALEWQTGKPSAAGCYAVRFKVSETAPGELHNFARWDGFQWKAVRSGKVIDDLVAVAWFPLPEV